MGHPGLSYSSWTLSDKTKHLLTLYLKGIISPSFTGDEANLLPLRLHSPSLPPFLVCRIQDLQNISKLKAQGLAEEATIPSLVIVKERPKEKRNDSISTKTMWERPLHDIGGAKGNR